MTLYQDIDPSDTSLEGLANALVWAGHARNERGQILLPKDFGVCRNPNPGNTRILGRKTTGITSLKP